jgi:hypothetical protein
MLPRNPLPLGNAGLGRSNFGLQFGLQNNPILSGLGRGGGNALGWFMQAGLTIPFGKIPDIYRNQASQPSLDTDVRQARQEQQRNLFNPGGPNNSMQPGSIKTNVNGRIMSMGAYNYATIPNTKIPLPDNLSGAVSDLKLQSPKIVALTSAEVYSKPLNVGEKIGTVEVGNEYAYLGHTKSGWVKLLMPNGKEGWTSTTFEYLKNDYTEIDDLALSVPSVKREKTAFKPEQKHPAQKRAQ